MPRKPRSFQGNTVYHVLNRAAARAQIFSTPADYAAFETTLQQALARFPLRLLAYVLMPTHFHLVLWPTRTQGPALSEFMRWLQVTHVQRFHAHHHTSGTGPLYQGRFKAFPIQGGSSHFQYPRKVCRYVERNPLRAGLVPAAQQWPWSSLHRRLHGSPDQQKLLAPWPPHTFPGNSAWTTLVNRPQNPSEEQSLLTSLHRNRPFGTPAWTTHSARRMNLEHTLRPRGRPKKEMDAKQ